MTVIVETMAVVSTLKVYTNARSGFRTRTWTCIGRGSGINCSHNERGHER